MSMANPAQFVTYKTWDLQLGRLYGLGHKFYPYCLLRGSGIAFIVGKQKFRFKTAFGWVGLN